MFFQGDSLMNIWTEADKIWIDKMWQKLDNKFQVVAIRSRGKIPFQSENGMHIDMQEGGVPFWTINWWTNGFWPGLMWLMYAGTRKVVYKDTAIIGEDLLEAGLMIPEKLSHDVGFVWKLAAGPDFALTNKHISWQRLRLAANHLMGRFNPVGEYLRAWDWGSSKSEKAGVTIIDTMMNLSLLFWASEDAEDPRFRFVAMKHADKTMMNHIREDGSVRHIVEYDPYSGEVIGEQAGQGYAVGSSWSRGQAWAIYGFTIAYIYTKKEEYLNTAKKVANYFILNVKEDWLPRCDFRAPETPIYYDSSAGACAACGLIELAKFVSEQEQEIYTSAAIQLLKALESNFVDWSVDTDFVLRNATGSYAKDHNVNLIYADYFFVEAVYKLKGFNGLFW